MSDQSPQENGNAAAAAQASSRRKRSAGFPVVSLAEASSILKEAGKYGFDHSTAAFATYMGHSTTNSGAFRQRLAAFRDWSLIAGRGDSLSLTDVAQMIAHPTDPASERGALQAAFMNSSVFVKLFESSAKGQPLTRVGLGSRAVHDLRVSPSSKDKFVESFVDSAVAAGLAEIADDGEVVLLPIESDDAGGAVTPQPASTGPKFPVSRPQDASRTTPVVYQDWPIDGGTIVLEIRCNKPLPARAYSTVGEVVASLERLSATLSSEAPDDQVERRE